MCLGTNLHKLPCCSGFLLGPGIHRHGKGLLLYGLIESILSNYLDRLNGVSYKEAGNANSSGQASLAEHAKLLRGVDALHRGKAGGKDTRITDTKQP